MGVTFANPAWLWACLLLLPLHFVLRRAFRAKDIVVPCLHPWKVLLPAARSASRLPWREYLLAMTAGGACLVSLAKPQSLVFSPEAIPPILVVDTSLSMGTRSSAGLRRIDQVTDVLTAEGISDVDQVFLTSRISPLESPVSGNALAALLREETLAAVSPEDTRYILHAALQLARRKNTVVLWISDRGAPLQAPEIRQMIVGEPSRNLAILDASRTGEHAFATIANYADIPKHVSLEWGTRAQRKHRELALEAGETRGIQLLCPADWQAEGLAVRLTGSAAEEDGFPEDNEVLLAPLTKGVARVEAGVPSVISLALETVGQCRVEDDLPPALIVTGKADDLPAGIPVFLVAPQAPVLGIRGLLPEEEFTLLCRNTRLRSPLSFDAPQTLAGGRFSPAILPFEAEILLMAEGERSVPFAAKWIWQGRSVVWLAAVPEAWATTPGFAVFVGEVAERLLAKRTFLPGKEESDNRIPERNSSAREFPVVKSPAQSFSLHQILIGLASAACLLLSFLLYKKRAL